MEPLDDVERDRRDAFDRSCVQQDIVPLRSAAMGITLALFASDRESALRLVNKCRVMEGLPPLELPA